MTRTVRGLDSPVAVSHPEAGAYNVVRNGDTFADDHPYVRSHPWLFADGDGGRPVETATAAPGEKRAVGHPCPDCDFVAKSRGGLSRHRRTHD